MGLKVLGFMVPTRMQLIPTNTAAAATTPSSTATTLDCSIGSGIITVAATVFREVAGLPRILTLNPKPQRDRKEVL